MGKGWASSFTLYETDFSGTQTARLLSVGSLFSGLLFYDKRANAYTDVPVNGPFTDLENGSLVNRVRYDSPIYKGFQLSASTAENQRSDMTLRWKDEIGDFQFSGANAAQNNPSFFNANWRVDGILGTLHQPTGLNLAFGAAVYEIPRESNDRNAWGWIVKAGQGVRTEQRHETTQKYAEMLANYITQTERGNLIVIDHEVWLLTASGKLVGVFPIDYLTWTAGMDGAERVASEGAAQRGVKAKVLLLEGQAAPATRKALEWRGWQISENVQLAAGFLMKSKRSLPRFLSIKRRCPTTVIKNGIALFTQSYNAFNNAEKSNRGAVLAKPFPCSMSQWVTRTFDNNYSQL